MLGLSHRASLLGPTLARLIVELLKKIPWKCRLVVGTGTGALPVMKELKREAKRRKIENC
jgi:hypothetical protein